MKVEVNGIEEAEDFTHFRGLAKDRDGDIWLFLQEKCLWASGESDFALHDKETIIKNHSPFTVFTGSLTISN